MTNKDGVALTSIAHPEDGLLLERKVAEAIMRAYFDRDVEIREINVTVDDNLDLARAAISAMEIDPASLTHGIYDPDTGKFLWDDK